MLTDVFTADTSGLFIIILAVIGITGEWRHHTITSSLLAAPDRIRFLAAKTIAFAVAGLVLSLPISLAIAIVGLVILSARDLPTPRAGDLIAQFARNAMVAALLGAFGVGLGALVRNQVVGDRRACSCSRSSSSPLLIGLAPTSAASARSARCRRRRPRIRPRTPACRGRRPPRGRRRACC